MTGNGDDCLGWATKKHPGPRRDLRLRCECGSPTILPYANGGGVSLATSHASSQGDEDAESACVVVNTKIPRRRDAGGESFGAGQRCKTAVEFQRSTAAEYKACLTKDLMSQTKHFPGGSASILDLTEQVAPHCGDGSALADENQTHESSRHRRESRDTCDSIGRGHWSWSFGHLLIAASLDLMAPGPSMSAR